MTARRPPQPEPPPRRRRASTRKPWRVTAPASQITTVQLAERVMRARGESTCSRCRSVVVPGQQIGLVDGQWIHTACLLDRKVPMIGPSSGA